MRRIGIFLIPFLCVSTVSYAQEKITPHPSSSSNSFAEQFYLKTDQRFKFKTSEVAGLAFLETPASQRRITRYAVVTHFGRNAVKTQAVPGLFEIQDVQSWVKKNLEMATFEGVEIKKITVPASQEKAEAKTFYWVGQKGFESVEAAQAEIALNKAVVEAQGGNFAELVKQAQTAVPVAESEAPLEIKTPEQYQKEEELALKFLDQLDIGNELFGPLQGTPSGEPIVWQSFGETTWRQTNLEANNFSSQVGFWTNRVVFKGIKAPFNTVDPFVEATVSLESNGVDYKDKLELTGGIEWRPFARNALVYNVRPFSLGLLEFVRGYRFYLQYQNRINLKDEILNSRNHDLKAGVGIFYEFGVEQPAISEGKPEGFSEYVRRYVWGEYFGNYYFTKTDFSSELKFNAFIFNSSIILGLKTPGIPLPANPITDELVLMPYLRFEHVNNTEFSFPYENRYFLAAGARWMPFNNYHFKENEWLYKTKIFMEYLAVGGVQNAKQDGEAPNAVDHDLRFGIAISSRRF